MYFHRSSIHGIAVLVLRHLCENKRGAWRVMRTSYYAHSNTYTPHMCLKADVQSDAAGFCRSRMDAHSYNDYAPDDGITCMCKAPSCAWLNVKVSGSTPCERVTVCMCQKEKGKGARHVMFEVLSIN